MAKILRTEQLSVDGDNIRLTATDGNLIINSVSGDDLTQITSTTKIGEDISSLAFRDIGFDTDVSSLAANTSSVESMLVNVSKYGVYSLETSNLSTGTGSSVQTITLAGRAFVAKPTVTATLTGTTNDPIIAVMISDVSETATTGVYQVTFQFSDELPATGETDQSTNYKLNILANVNAADQDLDTIVDSVDSDRDGDGVENALDYDPDDASVTSATISLNSQFPNTISGSNKVGAYDISPSYVMSSSGYHAGIEFANNTSIYNYIKSNLSNTVVSSTSSSSAYYAGYKNEVIELDTPVSVSISLSGNTAVTESIKHWMFFWSQYYNRYYSSRLLFPGAWDNYVAYKQGGDAPPNWNEGARTFTSASISFP